MKNITADELKELLLLSRKHPSEVSNCIIDVHKKEVYRLTKLLLSFQKKMEVFKDKHFAFCFKDSNILGYTNEFYLLMDEIESCGFVVIVSNDYEYKSIVIESADISLIYVSVIIAEIKIVDDKCFISEFVNGFGIEKLKTKMTDYLDELNPIINEIQKKLALIFDTKFVLDLEKCFYDYDQ